MNSVRLDSTLLSQSTNQLINHVTVQTPYDLFAVVCFVIACVAYLVRGYTWDKKDPFAHLYFERPQRKDGSRTAIQQKTRNVATLMQQTDKNVVVFWGSQSGVAEGFADKLSRELHARFGLKVLTADLSNFDADTIAQLPETHFAFFLMSTFGEGDPSDNAQAFYEWIHNGTHSEKQLANLRYAAFGLGNSNYKYYNRVIDVVATALDARGGKAIVPVGKADDALGATTEDFLCWKDSLFSALQTSFNLEEQPIHYEPSLELVHDDSLDVIDLYDGQPNTSPFPRALTISNSRELFQGSTRNCMHIDFDINDAPDVHYKTGDHLAIWPVNPEPEIELLLTALNVTEHRDRPVLLRTLDFASPTKLPSPTTIGALFRHYLEICALPSRDIVRSLARYAPTEEARQFLIGVSGSKESYAQEMAKRQLTFGRLLQLSAGGAQWSSLPISFVIESMSSLQPRYYSISSSSVLSPRRVMITALVARTSLQDAPEEEIRGVTTNHLFSLLSNDPTSPATVFARVRKSKFKLPLTSSRPIIMIAAGTGIAPFRAFIAERAKLATIGKPVGEMILFFGCRDPDQDYIYRAELESLQASLGESKFKIFTAFSRAGAEAQDGTKVYVQDRVVQHGSLVSRLLVDDEANLYICGRASMAREVGRKVAEILSDNKEMSRGDVDTRMTSMRNRGQWQEDVWG